MLKASIAGRRSQEFESRAKNLSRVVVSRIPRAQLPSPCRMRHEAAAEIAHHRRALRHLRSTRSHALEANKRHIEAANRIISQKCGSSRDTADDVDPGAAPGSRYIHIHKVNRARVQVCVPVDDGNRE